MIRFKIVFIVLIASMAIMAQNNNTAELSHASLQPIRDSSFNLKVERYKLSNPYKGNANLNYDPFKTELNYNTLAGVGAATFAIGVGVHIYQQNAWWKDQRTAFHFQNDPLYALGIDKVGHFYGGALLSHLFSGALEAGNMQSETAAIWGSVLSFAFQMYVEIEDGFGPDWGFSPGDAAADFLGAGFTLSQYYFPFLKNFQVKFSYYPSKKLIDGLHKGNSIDDYEGQKYWLSMRVKNLLPKPVSNAWPEWLNIAAGIGVKNLDGSGGGQKNFYIGLDLDAEAIPLYGGVWQFIKNSLNYIHFPMPGIRISGNTAFFVFLF